jgi:aminotransferase
LRSNSPTRMFSHSQIDFDILKKRAFNLRWASVEEGVIPLTAADPDFKSAPEIAEAISQFSTDRYFSYAPPTGYDFFKEAMANFFELKRNIKAEPKFIFPVDSAAAGIDIICKAFLQPLDEAIIFNPVDFLFKYAIESNGGVAIPFAVPINPEDALDYTALAHLINAKTKMICLCNPLNPTGKVFTATELQIIGELAVKHQLIILSDEIWSDIIFTPNIFTSIASLSDEIRQQTIVVTGFSKSYGLAGLRIGALMASNEMHYHILMQASNHLSTVHGSNVLSQVAATTALTKCNYWLEAFVQHLQRMRNICVQRLNEIPGISCYAPQGCYIVFANITGTTLSSANLQKILLEQAKVAVVPGLPQWFGTCADGYIRISFATSEQVLQEAFSRMETTLKSIV